MDSYTFNTSASNILSFYLNAQLSWKSQWEDGWNEIVVTWGSAFSPREQQ